MSVVPASVPWVEKIRLVKNDDVNKWNVEFYLPNCETDVILLRTEKNGNGEMLNAKRIQEASPAVTGSFSLKYNDGTDIKLIEGE